MSKYIITKSGLEHTSKAVKSDGKKIVFAKGLFDVLTVLDVRYLREAKKQGDILIVGVYSDEDIKKTFGEKRPILNFEDRIAILKDLEMIDYIVKFDEKIEDLISADEIVSERIVDYDVVDAVLSKYRKFKV